MTYLKYILFFLSFLVISCQEELSPTDTEFHPNGITKTRQYLNKQGSVVKEEQFYASGNIQFSGEYDKKGNQSGLWDAYYETGKLWSQTEYKSGKQHGTAKSFYPNGNLRYEGYFENDQKTGIWSFYDESGKLIESQEFDE